MDCIRNDPRLRLDGTVAIVTGANHGIGAAMARKLAESGARVLISYLRIPSSNGQSREWYQHIRATATGAEVAAQIRDAGGIAVAVESDLSDRSTVPRSRYGQRA